MNYLRIEKAALSFLKSNSGNYNQQISQMLEYGNKTAKGNDKALIISKMINYEFAQDF